MKLHQVKRTQFIDRPVEEVWDFFSNPRNLREITPESMDFQIRSELPEEIYAGMIIEYQVRPIANIPMTWVTEITQVEKPYFFIDEQREGPYAFWHHQHHFKSVNGGTEVTDLVHYKVPLGFLGRIFQPIFVEPQLNAIFKYRNEALEKLLPKKVEHQTAVS